MSAYQTSGSITALYPGDLSTVLNSENPASGTASHQVALAQTANGSAQKVSVTLQFSAAPGAFEVALETSDIDNDADYVTELATLTSVNSSNVARAEFPAITALFARLRTITQNANGVNCIGIIGR